MSEVSGNSMDGAEEMDEFERALAKAMQRVDAPEEFAERLMGRVCANPTHDDKTVMNGAPTILDVAGFHGLATTHVSADAHGVAVTHVSEGRHRASGLLVMRRRTEHGRAWVGGAIAAVLVLGAFGAEQVHVRREREKVEIATRQFEAAVLVTDQALEQTRAQLARAGLRLGD